MAGLRVTRQAAGLRGLGSEDIKHRAAPRQVDAIVDATGLSRTSSTKAPSKSSEWTPPGPFFYQGGPWCMRFERRQAEIGLHRGALAEDLRRPDGRKPRLSVMDVKAN